MRGTVVSRKQISIFLTPDVCVGTHLQQGAACTLLLHAPSEGLCRQYASLVRNSLSALASAIVSVAPCRGDASLACSAGQAVDPHEWLALMPGGGALDAAMAVRLEEATEYVAKGGNRSSGVPSAAEDEGNANVRTSCTEKGGDSSALSSFFQPLQRLLLEGRQPPSMLLPALRVLRRMALATLTALAATGLSALLPVSEQHRSAGRRGTFIQVQNGGWRISR